MFDEKFLLLELVGFGELLATKCVFLNNQSCEARNRK